MVPPTFAYDGQIGPGLIGAELRNYHVLGVRSRVLEANVMRSIWVSALLALAMVVSVGTLARAEEPAPKDQPAEKITIPFVVQPNELRSYKVSVAIKGCVGVMDSAQLLVDAVNTMKVRHKYGVREGDGLLLLDISAHDVQVTVNREIVPTSSSQYPKLTLLLDNSWKVSKVFGVDGTRDTGQVPGLNYTNLILLFNVPDADKPHAIGESWISKLKLPGKPEEVTVNSTIKPIEETNGAKVVTVHQEYAWGEQKLDAGRSVKSTAVVDSTFDLATGRLLKSHAECQLPFSEPAQAKPENRQYKATSKIDVSLEK